MKSPAAGSVLLLLCLWFMAREEHDVLCESVRPEPKENKKKTSQGQIRLLYLVLCGTLSAVFDTSAPQSKSREEGVKVWEQHISVC